jgi:hypothetical protein
MTPEQRQAQRRILVFSPVAAVVVLLLAFLQLQHGTPRTIGQVIGLPVILILLLVVFRTLRVPKKPN